MIQCLYIRYSCPVITCKYALKCFFAFAVYKRIKHRMLVKEIRIIFVYLWTTCDNLALSKLSFYFDSKFSIVFPVPNITAHCNQVRRFHSCYIVFRLYFFYKNIFKCTAVVLTIAPLISYCKRQKLIWSVIITCLNQVNIHLKNSRQSKLYFILSILCTPIKYRT